MDSQDVIKRDLVPTGVFGLDEILQGGIIKGNVIVLEGMPGTGKTTVAVEFVYRGAVEFSEPGVIVTFETSPDKLIRDAAGFGWDLKDLEDRGLLKIIYTSPVVLLEELQSHDGALSREIQRLNAKRVVIDGLAPLKIFGEQVGGQPFRETLHLLIETLVRFETTPLLTTEASSTNPIGETGSNQEQFLCDTIITLRNQARRRSVHRSIEIAKSRGQDFKTGRHSFVIVPNEGIKVFPRVYSRPKGSENQPTSDQRTSVGIAALDEMMGGGVYNGAITLVVGISGTGKTVVGMQFLAEGARLGKKGLLVTLDEHPKQICRNADALGVEFKSYVDSGDILIHFDSPLELDIDEHFHHIKRIVEEQNIERVVIDSIAAYDNAQPEESHEFILALSAFLKSKLISTNFNFETPELLGISQISNTLKASAVADNIMLLNYVEISTTLRRAITIPKSRGSRIDKKTREFVIEDGGIKILEDKAADVEAVPQLPLSSYYGVLARSPTRHSPVIEEHVATGKPLPKSKVPRPMKKSAKQKKKVQVKRKT